MLKDDPPERETAEERAQRYWRNNQVIARILEREKHIEEEIDIAPPQPPLNNYLHQLRKFKRDIKNIVSQRPTEMLTQYLISIQSRKNKLLKEKLKRLERTNVNEL